MAVAVQGDGTRAASAAGERPGDAAGGRPAAANGGHGQLSDDEILGLGVRTRTRAGDNRPDEDGSANPGEGELDARLRDAGGNEPTSRSGEGEEYRNIFESEPELKRAWEEARAYREAFATPDEARAATRMLTDLRAMDSLFFSKRDEDKAELARLVEGLDPGAFESLTKAMSALAAERAANGRKADVSSQEHEEGSPTPGQGNRTAQDLAQVSARRGFLQEANAGPVTGVLEAIDAQARRVLPESVSRAARERVVGEIYRELDKSLQGNAEFARQVRGAVRSGNFDAAHQNAVVSLIVNRAKQSLPSVAKRVLNEWTSTILAANQDRRTKQASAESRVDIAGAHGGKERQSPRSPRDIDYSRMSDTDILNL